MGYGQVAATSIGAGDVRVSPLDMALAAGVVAVRDLACARPGHRPVRSEFRAKQAVQRRDRHVLARADAGHRHQGRGPAAANVPGGKVFGQVGGSALGSGVTGLRSTWFVGYQGK